MKAILYDIMNPQKIDGKPAAINFRDVEEPTLPGDDWIKIKPIYSGVCGTDMGAIFYQTSPSLSPFNSFPSVLGHEVVGIVTETGSNVEKLDVGQRIAVDPYISCEVRGRKELCPACREGLRALCRYKGGDEAFGPGMILGFSKELPGSWGESLVIHKSMAVPIPDSISDKVAAMLEPLSVGMHAVLRQPPKRDENVLVIGGGIIAYSIIAAIQLLNIDCNITHVSLMEYQKQMGLTLGANEALMSRKELEQSIVNLPETKSYKPLVGRNVYTGGFDAVYDCIGNGESLDDALRMVRARGKVTLVGCAAEIKRLDLSFVWANELSVLGTHAYSKKEVWEGKVLSTHELLLERIEQNKSYPLEQLATHEFSLEQYEEAIMANLDRESYQSIKTLFKI